MQVFNKGSTAITIDFSDGGNYNNRQIVSAGHELEGTCSEGQLTDTSTWIATFAPLSGTLQMQFTFAPCQ